MLFFERANVEFLYALSQFGFAYTYLADLHGVHLRARIITMRLGYVKILGDGGLWSESFSKSNRTCVVIVGNVKAIPKLGLRQTMGPTFYYANDVGLTRHTPLDLCLKVFHRTCLMSTYNRTVSRGFKVESSLDYNL